MARFTIYSPTGTALYTGAPSYTGQYMKPGILEFREVAIPALFDLVPGCYVDYSRTGYRYRIYTVPQLKKQARSLSYGGAFVYQSVQLYDASKMLEYCPFRDLVLGDNRIHFSTQPSIATFEGCDGLARRFEACLRDQYDVDGVQSWAVRIATEEENPDLHSLMLDPRDFSVSGANILECLDKIYEIWPGVGWVYTVENDVDTIIIGGGGINANTGTYAYGKGNGLTSLTRTAANANEIANRIYAYGSSRNMLPRWYNSQNIKDAESVDIQNLMIPVSSWGETDGLPDAAKAYVEDLSSIAKNGLRPTTVYFDGKGEYPEIYPSLRETTIGMVRTAIGDSTAKYYPSTAVYTNPDARIDRLLSAQASFDRGVAGESGSAKVTNSYGDISATDSGEIDANSTKAVVVYEEAISVDSATHIDLSSMVSLGGTLSGTFATARLTIDIIGYMSGGITYNAGHTAIDFKKDLSGVWVINGGNVNAEVNTTGATTFRVRVELVLGAPDLSDATYSYALNGNVSFGAGLYRAKTFNVTLRQIGFDIGAQADLGNGKTIAMRTGMCAGRSFAIKSVQYDSDNDAWLLECWRSEDESLSQWFPNTDYPVRGLENSGLPNEYPGDEFVLIDIAMPDIYVQMAEQKLLAAAQDLLADTAVERWQYSPEIDAKYMVENNRTIRAGEFLVFYDENLIPGSGGGIRYFRTSGGDYFLTSGGDKILLSGSGAVRALVDTVVINDGEAAIPTYKVTLRDRKKKTWTESQTPETSSSKSVADIQTANETPYIDLSGYVRTDEFNDLAARVTALEDESFFMLDTNGNVTLKASYANLWVPGWMAAGGIGSGSSGGGTDLDRVWQSLTNNTDKPNVEINPAHIPDITTSKVSDIELWIAGKNYITAAAVPDESTVAGWGFTKNSGTVTSVTITQGSGITITNSGTAITTSGSRTISINSTYRGYIEHGETAYGWGNHATQGYITQTAADARYVSLSGDQTISGDKNFGGSIYCFDNGDYYWSIDPDGSAAFDNVNANYAAFSDLYAGGVKVEMFFEKVNIGTSANPVYAIRVKNGLPLYSDSWVAAGGVGSGSSGGADLDRVWQSLTNNTDKPNVEINPAHIPNITTSKITDLETWISGKGYTQNTGTVTSVTISAGNGISVSSTAAITTSGTRTISIAPEYLTDIQHGATAYGWGDHSTEGYLKGITSAMINSALGFSLSGTAGATYNLATIASNAANGNTAYGWGNHATEGYLKGITGTMVNNALGFTISGNSGSTYNLETIYTYAANGNTAYGWGNHATAGYVTSSALSTWSGSSYITKLGTVASGSIPLSLVTDADDLKAIEALSGTSGLLKKTAANTWALDTTQYVTASDLSSLATRVQSIEDWFEVVNVGTSTSPVYALHAKNNYAIYSDSWVAAGGVGSGSGGGGGVSVSWGTKSGYTRPLTVGGVTETLLLNGALNGYATENWVQNRGYLTSHQSVTLASGTNNGTLKLTTAAGTVDNIAVMGLGSLAYKSSLVAADIPDLSGTYVTLSGAQTISGAKTFTQPLTLRSWITLQDSNGNVLGYYQAVNATTTHLYVGANEIYQFGNDAFIGLQTTKNLGSSSSRWGKLWAGDADLSGSLSMARASTITIGPVTISYDDTHKALHISGTDNNVTIGLYCDGWVAAGGIQQGA